MCKPRSNLHFRTKDTESRVKFCGQEETYLFFESFLGTYADDKDTTVAYHQQPYQQADITFDQHFDAIMSMLMGYLYIYTTSNTSLMT